MERDRRQRERAESARRAREEEVTRQRIQDQYECLAPREQRPHQSDSEREAERRRVWEEEFIQPLREAHDQVAEADPFARRNRLEREEGEGRERRSLVRGPYQEPTWDNGDEEPPPPYRVGTLPPEYQSQYQDYAGNAESASSPSNHHEQAPSASEDRARQRHWYHMSLFRH